MIRNLLIFWCGPIAIFWSWYYLSYYDLSLGLFFYSRELHDRVFDTYGALFGIEPASIPPMIAHALCVDSLIVLSLVLLRKHKPIWAFLRGLRDRRAQSRSVAASEESLSSAP